MSLKHYAGRSGWSRIAVLVALGILSPSPAVSQEDTAFPEWCQKFLRSKRTKLVAVYGSPWAHSTESGGSEISSLALSPDGKTLLSGGGDRRVRLWDIASGKPLALMQGHSERVAGVAFLPDGKTAISCSPDNTLRLWNLADGTELKSIDTNRDADRLALLPGGTQVLVGTGASIHLWDIEKSELALKFPGGHRLNVWSIVLSADGKRALSGSSDKTLRWWSLPDGKELRVLQGHESVLWSVHLLADGKRALSGSGDKTVKLWDLETGQALRTLSGHKDAVRLVAATPDGKIALSADSTLVARLWDLDSGELLDEFMGKYNDGGGGRAVVFPPDGKSFILGTTGGALLRFEILAK